MSQTKNVTYTERSVSGETRKWIERLARLGYAALGVVYALVGILALQAAFTAGGRTTGTQGALLEIVTEPFGEVLLAIIALGLIGYALWQWVRGFMDPDGAGSDAKGLAKRTGYIISGIGYGALAVIAVQLIMGSGGGGGNSAQDWTARLMAQPFGRWLVGLIGLVVIGVGIYQLYKAYTAKFRQRFKLREMDQTEEKWATRSGRLGLGARGVVFGLIGIFFVQAAWQYDPDQAGGLGKALQTLAQQPYGPWLLGIVALGLVAYGAYSFALARYRRIWF